MKMRMKLRNKKTGEIGDLMGSLTSCPHVGIGIDFHDGDPKAFYYNSLAELNEDWEDLDAALVRTKNSIEFLERKLKSEKALLAELCGEDQQ